MKAWKVGVKGEVYSAVVFAETRGKARYAAMRTDCCEDTPFIEIYAYRLKEADKAYRGQYEADWYNDNDRLILVRDCGYGCEYPEFLNGGECESCVAKECCQAYKDAVREYCE